MSPPSTQPEFSCETCNLPFQRKEHYQRHLRTHTKEKPFTCSECGQSFGRVDSLARHHTTLHLSADRQDSRDRPNDRRRVSQACKPCSTSKVRCDGEHPCQRCRQQDNDCYYEPHAKRKMSEASSDRPISKRNREKAPVNVEAMESINVNVNSRNSPLSPPATVQDNGSNKTSYAENYLSPAHDPFIELSRPDDLNANIQAIDPQLDAQHSSSIGYQSHQHGPSDILFDTDDILAKFNSANTIPAPLPSMLFGDAFDTNGWLNYGADQSFAPLFLQNDASLDAINELWFDHAGFKAPQQPIVSQLTPASSMVDQSAVAELYSRSHSPAIDRDAVEPREYVALLDSAFSAHFDLTSLMRLSELQISLPQPDDRWGASTAQCWANFPAVENSGSGGLPTMERVISEDSWRFVWSKTNTLGKQVMLQHLTNVIKDKSADQPGTPGFSYHDKLLASNVLTDFLNLIETDQMEQSIDEAKASTTHKIMALTALMTHNTPVQSLLPTTIRCIYGKLDNKDWAAISDRWRGASGQGRLGCFYASRILHVVRSSRSSHFGTPVSLLQAVLVLWLYSALAERYRDGFLFSRTAPAVVLGPKPLDQMETNSWIEMGWSRVKLPGIGNLLCAEGRTKLLDDAVVLMRSLKGWGISNAYAQILLRLRASEAASMAHG
ncbi:hypothetical protein FOMG_18502 [Fusarium oxysporum f. sp. melonis 26406]|uniref:Uncharacterized protein n=1 Tax=Fusarium oxysporum f. sp. melonis 26406 TaxID=1089452 RepID=W9Z951_FUSOX|nr:hypothetical protein FOMG_18502 [Fusarium oxysporum f. sp. melonis 26406]